MLSYQRLDGGLQLLMLVGALPMAILAGFLGGDGSAVRGLVVGALLAGIPLSLALLSGAAIKLDRRSVWIGFVPFYFRRLSFESIARVDVTRVAPFEDFGGWGIKGRSRRRGLLLSAGGTEVIAFEMVDGRRYLVSAQNSEGTAAQIRQALHGRDRGPGARSTLGPHAPPR